MPDFNFPNIFTKAILLVNCGQSIRKGSAKRLKAGATDNSPSSYENVMTRARSKSVRDPIAPSRVRQGSWLPQIIDRFAMLGVDLDVLNCAIGGSSVRDWHGRVKGWTANTAYNAQRGPLNGDAGDKGDFIVAGGKLWRCTTGRQRIGYNATNIDYMQYNGTQVSGGAAPNWASVTTVGGTLNDGGIVWTLVENGNANNYATTTAIDPTNATLGDPLGLEARMIAAVDAAVAAKTYDEVWYLWGSGSAETPALNGAIFYANDEIAYRDRMQMFANRALARGASYVALGLDPWFPDLGPTRQSQVTNRQPWDVLDRALERAIVSYQGGANDGKVGRAANLYRLFKFSPPVYREDGLTIGVHLTLEGNEMAGEEEGRLLEAKLRGLPGVTGAVRAPYIEPDPILLSGVLAGISVNSPFIHISNTAVASATVGQTLSLFVGSWAGGWLSSQPNQWLRDGVPIPGATGSTYVTTSADAGKTITATSSKTNPAGTSTATTPLGVTVS